QERQARTRDAEGRVGRARLREEVAMIRVPLGGISAGPRVLTGDAARYVARVHRLETGDAFLLFDPDARVEARATITGQSRGRVEVVIAEPTRASMVASRRIEWIHALPKGDKADAIVQDATELGASSIRFVSTSRAVVRLDAQRAANRIKRWQKIARECSRQCGRGDVPAVLEVVSWEEALRLAPS